MAGGRAHIMMLVAAGLEKQGLVVKVYWPGELSKVGHVFMTQTTTRLVDCLLLDNKKAKTYAIKCHQKYNKNKKKALYYKEPFHVNGGASDRYHPPFYCHLE